MADTGFLTAAELNDLLPGTLPGLLGIVVDTHEPGRLTAHLDIRTDLLAPNGYLHAATVVALADTSCGLPTRALLPEGSSGFTTIELKSNHLSTAREGRIEVVATNIHAGRTTQVWDAVVTNAGQREDDRAVPLHAVGALAAVNPPVTPMWRRGAANVRLAPPQH